MQEFLHMRTLFLATSIMGLILFICMLTVLRARKTYYGFHYWTASALCYFLGNVLIGLRGEIPDLFSIVAANSVTIYTLLLIAYGISVFVNKGDPPWLYLAVGACVPLVLAYFTYLTPSIRARIVIVSAAHCLACIYCLHKLLRDTPVFLKKHNLLLKLSFASGALWSLFRMGYTLFYDRTIESMLAPSLMLSASLIVYCVLVSFIGFGLCLFNFQRTEHELLSARDEVKQLSGFLPMCATCKKIRVDKGYWNQVEAYIRSHSEAVCSHSICPDCLQRLYPEYCDQTPEQDPAKGKE
ncbi:MAG: hypothetical protein HZB24_12930 [Desulfobacterales bacterium]|nr:hypothetical protein [Desulfobacterales bacterium]